MQLKETRLFLFFLQNVMYTCLEEVRTVPFPINIVNKATGTHTNRPPYQHLQRPKKSYEVGKFLYASFAACKVDGTGLVWINQNAGILTCQSSWMLKNV